MLKINIFVHLNPNGISSDDFNIENFIQYVKDAGLQAYIMQGSYPLSVNINGTEILGKKACYPFNENLKSLNNLFYKVITSADGTDNKINFIAGLGAPENYLSVVKKDNKILLSGSKGISFVTDFAEWLDLEPAVQEIIGVVNEYKDICNRVGNELNPNNIGNFMNTIFVEPTWNNEPWFPLEDAWESIKKDNI